MTQAPPDSAPASTEATINYKDTLNLPVTAFKMKAGAATREPEIEAFWDEQQVYQRAVLGKQGTAPKFVLHDGPPYLSSDKIHIGTALNKILKDIITRYKTQRGFFSPYIPGYDGHGLPIENAALKDIKGGRSAISPADLRAKCRALGMTNLKGQEDNFKRLGCWGEWERPYVTTTANYEATQIRLFWDMYEKGYAYKGLKPVYWSPSSESALADAEIEYDTHQSHSIFVAFPAVTNTSLPFGASDKSQPLAALAQAKFVIWTTTPWTLPSNLALSIHPELDYVVVTTANWGKLVICQALLESVTEDVGLENPQIVASFKGEALEGLLAQHPFLPDRQVPVLLGKHVTTDAGTGIVHTAPGHGTEDFGVCQGYNNTEPYFKTHPIAVLSPIDNKGCFNTLCPVPELVGQFYEDANTTILEILKTQNALLHHSKFNHSYPHDWRTHKPVIYRATEQWFIDVNAFRDKALAAIKQVDWIPKRGESRIASMVENRTDWCISRQRVWGVPIPVFYNQTNGEVVISLAMIEHLEWLFNQHTSDIWWAWSPAQLLEGLSTEALAELKLPMGNLNDALAKEMDIMDVWMDSGVSHSAVVAYEPDRFVSRDDEACLPVELYLEGSDQHRGWFQSSLLSSVMLYDRAPFRSVLTHGFVLDENGRKMSKSLGNVVDPHHVMNQYGADVLRLWVASVDYANDVRIGGEILTQLAEVYKKVRNTVRYMLGNLHDFNPATDRVSASQLSLLDQVALDRLNTVIDEVTQAFDQYAFYRYYQLLQNFCVVDLSQGYFDLAKDILYCHAKADPARRAIQTVLYEVLSKLVPMLVPVMPHLAEDIWLSLPDTQRWPDASGTAPLSVVMLPWPEPSALCKLSDAERQALTWVLSTKEQVNKLLEGPRSAGQIGSSIEAAIAVDRTWLTQGLGAAKASFKQDSAAWAELFETLWIVSDVQWLAAGQSPSQPVLAETSVLGDGDSSVAITLFALQPQGTKCTRCWKIKPKVGSHAQHPGLCQRCLTAVEA
jgi:isoleucyl-tRNA synthetase